MSQVLMLSVCLTSAAPERCRASEVPNITLGDGETVPAVGLGLYYTPPGEQAYTIVLEALRVGYRHFDTAGFYDNEADVGRAVRDSGVDREDIHITSKVWPSDSFDAPGDGLWVENPELAVLNAVRTSVLRLGTHADLYLIHAPFNPSQRIAYWRALEEVQRL